MWSSGDAALVTLDAVVCCPSSPYKLIWRGTNESCVGKVMNS